jgi:hypothetical protein
MAIAKETVIIGCKAPSGFLLEVGLQSTVKNEEGKLVTMIIKGADYQAVTIKGWNAHTEDMRRQLFVAGSDTGLPHGMNTRPFLNRGVPKDFWVRWSREHPNSWLLKNEILFVADDEASAASRVADAEKTPKILEPLDRNKKIIPGIETADFARERGGIADS